MNRKSSRRQGFVAAVTTETFFVPSLLVVQDATFRQRLTALGAAFGVLILVANGAVKLAVFWNEAACSYSFMADGTFEALFMPIGSIVFEASAP